MVYNKLSTNLIIALILASCSAASAKTVREMRNDSIAASQKVVMIDGEKPSNDSLRAIIDEFYYDQFRSFKDPLAPYFLFMSRDGGMTMGIGGQFNFQGYYDWNQVMPSFKFTPSDIPVPGDPTKRRGLGATVNESKLFFRVLGNNKLLNHWQVYLEAKFTGGSGGKEFKLSKAYFQFRDYTLGMAKSTFSDPSANPPTVDPQGTNSLVGQTAFLARWMHSFNNGIVVAGSLEVPDQKIATDGTTTSSSSQSTPDVAAFLQYEWSSTQHVRLAGIVSTMSYHDLISQTTRHATGYGVLLSTVFNPISPLTIYGYTSYGKGIASLSNDLSSGNYDLFPDPDIQGRMYTPASAGWLVAAQYHFRPNLFSTIMFSEYRFLPSHKVAPDTYKYGLYGAANLFYEFSPRLQFGIEYNYGRRQNMDRRHTSANQITAIATVNF